MKLQLVTALSALTMGLTAGAPARADHLQIDIQPLGLSESSAEDIINNALNRREIRQALSGIRYRVLGAELSPSSPSEKDAALKSGFYLIQIYDYTNDRLLTYTVPARDVAATALVTETKEQLVPSNEEFDDAVRILERDPAFSSSLALGLLRPYEAMPPFVDPKAIGAKPHERIIPVGLQPFSSQVEHEIVAVNLSHGSVHRFPTKAPPTALAAPRVCGPPSAGQAVSRKGTAGSATVNVNRDGENLWRLKVIRPAASSGRLGSGVELKDVYYKGHLVLKQAHVPIINVQYDRNVCGPYRDWAYAENPFSASGTAIASGILRASSRPSSVLDSGVDRGNFRGVAIYEDGPELVLMSEISAGWYRYVSEYRLHEDGTIRPIFRLGGVHNSCVCNTHHHHVYWRFDFDMDGARANNVEVLGTNGWKRVTTEQAHKRDSAHRGWRIVNPATRFAYEIEPGHHDGRADDYAQNDIWILKYKGSEIDDGAVRTSTRAALNRFVTGESIATDAVLWYAAHYTHITNDVGVDGPDAVLGPIIRPSVP